MKTRSKYSTISRKRIEISSINLLKYQYKNIPKILAPNYAQNQLELKNVNKERMEIMLG